MRKLVLLAILPLAYAQSVPAGAIYQAAIANGVEIVPPVSGIAIVNEKSGTNIKNVILEGLGQTSISVLSAGVSGAFALSKPWLTGLALSHLAYDTEIEPVLQASAPTGLAGLPPVLLMSEVVMATSTSCSEYTIFASAMRGVKPAVRKSDPQPSLITATVGGLAVTFSPQGVLPLKNATGTRIKKFMGVDTLACAAPVTNSKGEEK